MISFRGVTKSYEKGGKPALSNITLDIEDGEFVFVVGSSGSGKSTFIKLLLKELDATEGEITVAGHELSKMKNKDIPKFRRNIGVVF